MVSDKGRAKFDLRILLFVAIGIFIIAIAVFGSSYSQRTKQLGEANRKLSSAQARVAAVNLVPFNSRKVVLEQQANQTAAQLKAVGANLSPSINRTATIGVLFATAKAHALEVTSMTFTGPSNAFLDEMPVSAALLTATVEGDMSGLAAFITELNTFKNGAVDSVVITTNATGNATNNIKSWADIKMTFYTVQGR